MRTSTDSITKTSAHSVTETVNRFRSLLDAKGLKVFAVIDQQAEAHAVGLELRETTLVIFGNPAAGTGVMGAVPLSALDLPLKVLVWADADDTDDNGGSEGTSGAGITTRTRVSYTAPAALAARYGLTPDQAAAFEGINALTDALVAS